MGAEGNCSTGEQQSSPCADKYNNYGRLPNVISNAYFEQVMSDSNLWLEGKRAVQYLSRNS